MRKNRLKKNSFRLAYILGYSQKMSSQYGLAVWPDIENIYIYTNIQIHIC